MSAPPDDQDAPCSPPVLQARPGTFRPGVSDNPRGRPRAGLALAEKIRELVDPGELVGMLLGIARDPAVAVKQRLAAISMLADRGWSKPPMAVEIEAPPDQLDPLAMTPLEREAEIELLLKKRADAKAARAAQAPKGA